MWAALLLGGIGVRRRHVLDAGLISSGLRSILQREWNVVRKTGKQINVFLRKEKQINVFLNRDSVLHC
jgi:hypothetical protein